MMPTIANPYPPSTPVRFNGRAAQPQELPAVYDLARRAGFNRESLDPTLLIVEDRRNPLPILSWVQAQFSIQAMLDKLFAKQKTDTASAGAYLEVFATEADAKTAHTTYERESNDINAQANAQDPLTFYPVLQNNQVLTVIQKTYF